jgi:hypothetical protein
MHLLAIPPPPHKYIFMCQGSTENDFASNPYDYLQVDMTSSEEAYDMFSTVPSIRRPAAAYATVRTACSEFRRLRTESHDLSGIICNSHLYHIQHVHGACVKQGQ